MMTTAYPVRKMLPDKEPVLPHPLTGHDPGLGLAAQHLAVAAQHGSGFVDIDDGRHAGPRESVFSVHRRIRTSTKGY